jgi:predicted phage terminase large subunit-like protein
LERGSGRTRASTAGRCVVELWRARCTKQEYLDKLRSLNDRYQPQRVDIEAVAAQEYLVQDAERYMPVYPVNRTREKVSRAYWLQSFFENGQVLFPEKRLQSNVDDWQALQDELILFPNAEHDDLFDALQTMVEGAIERTGSLGGSSWREGSRWRRRDSPTLRYGFRGFVVSHTSHGR